MEASTGVSYEQLRMEKLRRNQELMHSLGLTQSAASMPQASDRKSKATPKKKRVIENDETTPSGTRRRSPRLSGETPLSASTPGTDAAESENDEAPELPEHAFDTSKVLMYSMMEDDEDIAARPDLTAEGKALRVVGGGATDPSLKRMYTLSFHHRRKFMVGGGHQGRVALWTSICRSNQSEKLIMSFKAARGWVSGARFVDAMDFGLLVTGNDGEMNLFDCSKEKDGMPRRLLSQVMHGKSGIFDLDLLGSTFATCSKNGSLCIGNVGSPASFDVIRRFGDAHDGVAKSVMFQPGGDAKILCSGGNDSAVRVWDVRSKGSNAEVEIASSFNLAINVVRFNPEEPNYIVSASFASCMELFDIRKPKESAVLFQGHLPASCTRSPSIYQPVFIHSGKRLVASGGGSQHLTMFDTLTGEVVSSGFVGFQAGSLEAVDSNRIAVSHGQDVSFLDCV